MARNYIIVHPIFISIYTDVRAYFFHEHFFYLRMYIHLFIYIYIYRSSFLGFPCACVFFLTFVNIYL